jgi:hypothetical protein
MSTNPKDDAPADLPPFHQQKRPPLLVKFAWWMEDAITDIRWMHVGYKTLAYSYLAFMFWVLWQVLPVPGHWPSLKSVRSDKIPIFYQDFFK